jgi:phosphatidylglycerol lysyltransferase
VNTPALLNDLRAAARAEGRISCLYKINARTAVVARRAGWAVAPVAMDCRLDPQCFDPISPAHAGLRRKLRKAAKAGLVCTPARQPLPLQEMAQIASTWATSRGGERGFSMGRFTPDYLIHQEVILAHLNGRLVGFASFHTSAQEWVLDLMRPAPDAPDGTMQALIAVALDLARTSGLRRLSLAALPPEAGQIDGPAALIWRRAETRAGCAGLRQFKMGFGPTLSPLYIAAPSRAALALAAADIARTIHRPAALPGTLGTPRHASHSTSS